MRKKFNPEPLYNPPPVIRETRDFLVIEGIKVPKQ